MKLLGVLTVVLCSAIAAQAADWPGFRGPRGDGVSDAKGLPLRWSDEQNILWKTKLPGPGASSPITIGEHVYLTCYSGYGDGTTGGQAADVKRHLVCLRRRDGTILWDAVMPSQGPEFDYVNYINKHGYASSTPTADRERVYVFYGTSGAAAYSHAGKPLWHTECGRGVHEFGSAASPVLFGDLMIVNAEVESESLIALDKSTGRVQWRQSASVRPQRSRSTPVLVQVGRRHELVFDYRLAKLAAVDPASGELLWQCASVEKYQNPSPVAHAGVVYATGGTRPRTLAVRAGGKGDVTRSHRLWTGTKGSNVSSPILYEGHLYWAHEKSGIVYCAKADTGEVLYEKRLNRAGQFYASPVLVGGRLYYTTREGRTFVVAAKPTFELLATNTLDDRTAFNASGAVADGRLLLRSARYLYCLGQE